MKKYTVYLLTTIMLCACSTTKHLPEGQILYTGQTSPTILNNPDSPTGELALEEVETALSKGPNNSLFGSSRLRIPIPFGLWMYNAFVHSKSGIGKWLFKKLAATPVFISDVNPSIRQKAATNILHDYGFFQGAVTHRIIPNRKDSLKAKIHYTIDMGKPYLLDSIEYRQFTRELMEIIRRGDTRSALKRGNQFSVVDLDEERQRLNTIFRNLGYYYFRPDFFSFKADTTRTSGKVDLRIAPKTGIPANGMKRWNIGSVTYNLVGRNGEQPDRAMLYQDVIINYYHSLAIRPEILRRRMRIRPGQRFSQRRVELTQQKLAELGVFRYSDIQFTLRDSTDINHLLDVSITSAFDQPYDSRLEFNIISKSNDYLGPGATYSVSRKNLFKGGETFTVSATGSYEWQTQDTKLNSWEAGLNASLTYPSIIFPGWGKKDYDFTASTTFALNLSQLNRPEYFRMLSFGGEMSYQIQRTRVSRHTITPFKLTFSTLSNTTAGFDQTMNNNPALKKSMENQFIPAIAYTFTYDDASSRRVSDRNHFWWQAAVSSSGTLTSGIYALFGKGFNEEKLLLGANLAQYLKMTGEIRYTLGINRNQSLATRLMGGALLTYGGTQYAPYREQFFIGGANSIRAFTVRSLGPGSYRPSGTSVVQGRDYSYLDQTGDLKLEGNMEYRFRVIGNLHGAVFLDAGNVWLLRDRAGITDGKFSWSGLLDDIAVGSGLGIRYDLDYLVFRLDCGVALHLPYPTGKKGYYNIEKFGNSLGLHFAIGYPF